MRTSRHVPAALLAVVVAGSVAAGLPAPAPAAASPLVAELTARGGRWEFGRVNGGKLCDIVLTAVRSGGRYAIRSCNANESTWAVAGGKLVFYGGDGAPTTRFTRRSANAWQGPYLGTKAIPAQGIVHYLRR